MVGAELSGGSGKPVEIGEVNGGWVGGDGGVVMVWCGRFCNAYERRSAVLTASEQRIRM